MALFEEIDGDEHRECLRLYLEKYEWKLVLPVYMNESTG